MATYSSTFAQLTATATFVTLASGSTNGTEVQRIFMSAPTGTSNPGKIKLWLYDGSSTRRMIKEYQYTAIPSSTTILHWANDAVVSLWVPNGYSLQAEITVTATIDFVTSHVAL